MKSGVELEGEGLFLLAKGEVECVSRETGEVLSCYNSSKVEGRKSDGFQLNL